MAVSLEEDERTQGPGSEEWYDLALCRSVASSGDLVTDNAASLWRYAFVCLWMSLLCLWRVVGESCA
jgi:hypothetical protein